MAILQISSTESTVETDPLTGITQRRIEITATNYSSPSDSTPSLILSVTGTSDDFVPEIGIAWGTPVSNGESFQVLAGPNGLESEYSALAVPEVESVILIDPNCHDLNRLLYNLCLFGSSFRCNFATYHEGTFYDATFPLDGLKAAAEEAGFPIDLWRFWYSG